MSKQHSAKKIYSLLYRRLHWGLAVIIITLLLAGQQFNLDLTESHRIYGLKAHSSLGTIAFIIALVFIGKRFIWRVPTPKPKLSLFKRVMAKTAQLTLYVLAVVIPVSGMLCALQSHYPVYLFALFDLTALPISLEASFEELRSIHMWATRLAMFVVACHAGAALYHHFIVKDDVLKSMAAPDPLLTRLWCRLKRCRIKKSELADSQE